MLKFSGNDKQTGRPILGIGLSRENCDRLLEGQPIAATTEGMDGLPVMDLFIMAGETEAAMAEQLFGAGAGFDEIREDVTLRDPHVHPVDKEVN